MRTSYLLKTLALMASFLLLAPPLRADEKEKQKSLDKAKANASNITPAGPVQAPRISTDTHKEERIAREENTKEKNRRQAGPGLRIKEPPSPKLDKPAKPSKTDKPSNPTPKTDKASKPAKTEKPSKPPKTAS